MNNFGKIKKQEIDIQVIKELAEEYEKFADELVTKYQQEYNFPPLNSVNLAKGILNIKVKEENINTSGYSLKYKNEALIILNKNEINFRKNFTCAHEIAHIFFSEILARTVTENFEYKTADFIQILNRNEDNKKPPIEALCDSFASNLLLPSKFLEMYTQAIEKDFSFQGFEKLANSFNVNRQTLFIKIQKHNLIKNPHRFILKLSEEIGRKGGKKKLRVIKCLLPENSNFYIPEYKGADTLGLEGISKWICLYPSESTHAVENISLIFKDPYTQKWQSKNKIVECNVQYKCYGTEKSSYIMGLFEMTNHF